MFVRVAQERAVRVLHLRRPSHVQIAVRRGVARRVGRVRRRDHVLDIRDLRGLAPGDAPVGRFHDPLAVQRRQACGALEDHVPRPVVAHDRARALVVEDVARDVGRRAESCPAVGRVGEEEGRLDVAPALRIEEETRPADVDAIPERALDMPVHPDPRLVVQGRRRGRLADESCGVEHFVGGPTTRAATQRSPSTGTASPDLSASVGRHRRESKSDRKRHERPRVRLGTAPALCATT